MWVYNICPHAYTHARKQTNKPTHLTLYSSSVFQHKCCGIYGYTDFIKYAKTWNRTYIRTKDKKRIVVQAPLACCRQNDTFPEGVPIDDSCYTDPNEKNLYTEVIYSTEVVKWETN